MTKLPINQIICGDWLDVSKQIPDETISCCITSPPYWGLRAYGTEPQIWGGDKNCKHKFSSSITRKQTGGLTEKQKTNVGSYWESSSQFCSLCGAWRGELGLEPTIEMFIDHLIMCFDEVKRVLRKDGICFVNLGDSYATTPAGNKYPSPTSCAGRNKYFEDETIRGHKQKIPLGLVGKNLCLIPERFVIAMQKAGWIVRCKIIWGKGVSFCDSYSGSCMPDSAKDRPNKNGFENIWMFTKNKHYWYEQQYEEMETTANGRTFGHNGNDSRNDTGREYTIDNPLGRTIRNVWLINPEPCPEAHYATFPTALVEPMIKMGCPEFICKKCGKPRVKIYKTEPMKVRLSPKGIAKQEQGLRTSCTGTMLSPPQKEFVSYSDCGCNAGFEAGIVLDPFSGTSTVGVVAVKLKRNYLMVELKPEYVEIGKRRLLAAETGITVAEQKQGQKGLWE